MVFGPHSFELANKIQIFVFHVLYITIIYVFLLENEAKIKKWVMPSLVGCVAPKAQAWHSNRVGPPRAWWIMSRTVLGSG